MNVADYSTAVFELITEGRDEKTILDNLGRVLNSYGHTRLYPKILAELSQKLKKHEGKKGAMVTLARSADESVLKQEIKEALTKLGMTEYVTKVDPTITGGFIAEGGERRIDASYKKTLLTLYRSLIS